MAFVYLQKVKSDSLKKTIYKFEDGVLVKEFLGLTSAAFDANIPGGSMSLYLNKKIKKPRKIPANIDYSGTNKM